MRGSKRRMRGRGRGGGRSMKEERRMRGRGRRMVDEGGEEEEVGVEE